MSGNYEMPELEVVMIEAQLGHLSLWVEEVERRMINSARVAAKQEDLARKANKERSGVEVEEE